MIPTSTLRAPLALLSTLLLLAPVATSQRLAFSATLDGDQVVPPATTAARAIASVVVDLSTHTLHYDLTHIGLGATETAAAIHGFAAPGANAPALFQLPLGFKKTGSVSFAPAEGPQLLAQLAYIQIDTTTHPSGELRGQLLRDPSPRVLHATLDGQQEVPPNTTLARGTSHCSVDTVANTLTFTVGFEGIFSPQTAVHIHGPALPGAKAPPKFALPINAGNFLTGTWNYMESDEADILAGLMYWNVHSNAIPDGEIRGQIEPLTSNPVAYCTAKVTSLGCTPAMSWTGVASASAGSGLTLQTAPVPGQSLGIYFYGIQGPLGQPFQGGFLCLQPPTVRTSPQGSGGVFGVCDGMYAIDFNAHVASGIDPALVAGTIVNVQTWFRDAGDPVSGTGLSDALMLEIGM